MYTTFPNEYTLRELDNSSTLVLSPKDLNSIFQVVDGNKQRYEPVYHWHILVMSSLLNSTLLVYWDTILVDLAQDLHNTTEFLSSYRCISPKIFDFSLINKTFRLN